MPTLDPESLENPSCAEDLLSPVEVSPYMMPHHALCVMPLSCDFLGRAALVVFRAGWAVASPPGTACFCSPKLLVQWGAECCLLEASSHSAGHGNKVPWKELGSISAALLEDCGPSPWHFPLEIHWFPLLEQKLLGPEPWRQEVGQHKARWETWMTNIATILAQKYSCGSIH